MRRECLDWIIPLGEGHIRAVVRKWPAHHNRARPHMALGPGIPEPSATIPAALQVHRHMLPEGSHVVATPALAGMHHEYSLNRAA
jgi:hypothetical protein